MKEGAVSVRDRRDLGYRLDHARFVVGEHDRYQRRRRLFAKNKIEQVEPDDAVSVDWDSFGCRSRL
jgi:hypothetical protein